MDVQAVAASATAQAQEPLPAAPQESAAVSDQSAFPTPLAPHPDQGPLSHVVAHILSHGGVPHPVTVNVSYRVEHNPNIIVTVFTDPNTGREIAQAPPEVLVQLAQFFDKESGVTLDRTA